MMRLRITSKHILADAIVAIENVVKMAYSERSSKQTQLSAEAEKGPVLFWAWCRDAALLMSEYC